MEAPGFKKPMPVPRVRRLQVPARFVIFPDEGHWILKGPNSRKHIEEVMGWFKRYLEPAS